VKSENPLFLQGKYKVSTLAGLSGRIRRMAGGASLMKELGSGGYVFGTLRSGASDRQADGRQKRPRR
jgi:hypothetical protein